MENIGAKIKELRLLKGLTQEELAERTGLSVRTIQRIENGDVDPRTYTLSALAEALEVEVSEFTTPKAEAANPRRTLSNYNWIILLHLSGLFVLILPPLLIWMFKKNEIPEMDSHARDVLNFQFSIAIYLFASAILVFVVIGFPLLIFLALFSQVVIVLNTIKVMNREPYRYPWTIQILKP